MIQTIFGILGIIILPILIFISLLSAFKLIFTKRDVYNQKRRASILARKHNKGKLSSDEQREFQRCREKGLISLYGNKASLSNEALAELLF